MAKHKKALLILVLVFVFITALREFNWLDFHFSSWHLHILQHRNTTTYEPQFLEKVKSTESKDTINQSGRGYGIGIRLFTTANRASQSQSSLSSQLEEKIQSEMQKQHISAASVSFSITRAELRGTYWLPIYKTGTCEYTVNMSVQGDAGIKTGVVDGEMDFAVKGISSVVNLKDQVIESAAQAIVKIAIELVANQRLTIHSTGGREPVLN